MNNPEFNTELKEWIEALENTILSDGKEYSKELLKALFTEASLKGIVR
jgi:pyruvate dehydrogenase complex dehydrogenase (E1) component